LKDNQMSREETLGILLDLTNNGSIKLQSEQYFAAKTDDESTQDRRAVFAMLQFAIENEYKFKFDEFASKFADWYRKNKDGTYNADKALAALSLAITSKIIGLGARPGTRISCIGEILDLYVASGFRLQTNAPAVLPSGPLSPCQQDKK
jgi:hypothetical protein